MLAFACNSKDNCVLQYIHIQKYLPQDIPKPKSEIAQVAAYMIVTMLIAQVLVKVGEVDLPLRGQKEDFLRS